MGANAFLYTFDKKYPVFTREKLTDPVLDLFDTIVKVEGSDILYHRPQGSPSFIPLDTSLLPLGKQGQGFGVPGIQSTNFEDQTYGIWVPSNESIQPITNGGTPSTATGPTTGEGGGFYTYYEVSGAPDLQVTLTTGDYAKLTQVDFSTHMFGVNIGSLIIEVQPDALVDSWVEMLSINGQAQTASSSNGSTFIKTGAATQTSNASPWSNYSVTIPAAQDAERIRFRMTYGGSFNGDISLDNISITSI